MDYTSLFLAQSYKDTWDDYNRSLTKENFAKWDYVILTASNESQASVFRAQIEERRALGMLPSYTHFAVVSDKDGKRVGSGGATLGVIKYVAEHSKTSDFSGLRILVIHSGGDSKRAPQYSALGKIFSPVPHMLGNGRASTLFDEFIISMSSVPSRISEGMLLLSGDVLLLFNPLQIDYSGSDAAALSFKEDVELGKNHGVYLNGDDGYVAKTLQKKSVAQLRAAGAVNSMNCVDIDTGAVVFSSSMLSSLYTMVDTDEKFDRYVNDRVRLSLYADFLYVLASQSTLEEFYSEKPEGVMCDELLRARKDLWGVLRGYRMKLLRLAPAKFIHFGTTSEVLELVGDGIHAYEDLGWERNVNSSVYGSVAAYNSVLSSKAAIGDNSYLEVSYVHDEATVGKNVVLSYIDIHDETIPDGVVVHGLKNKDGTFTVRIWGINDNPKLGSIFGRELSEVLSQHGIDRNEIWDVDDGSIWSAKIYPACDSIREGLRAALNLYRIVNGKGDVLAWIKSKRRSLSSAVADCDPEAIIDWNDRMLQLVAMDSIEKLIISARPATEARGTLKSDTLTPIQGSWLEKKLSESDFKKKTRLYYYVGTALGGAEGDKYRTKCFETVSGTILEAALGELCYNESARITCDRHSVKLPLRVNFGGGWSDTPPYCIDNGGTVLNAAITLNGEFPVEVTLERIGEKKIVFDSRDMDVHGEFFKIGDLQRTGDPYDPFALQKACLLACGVIPFSGGNLNEILERLGGGFIMHSEVTNVPKGSGLGTSSILSAACVKAMLDFVGIHYTDDELCAKVLCMEQIMSTGGGWQDQVGGLSAGVKYITSHAGLKQDLKVNKISLKKETLEELNDRFCLIYTGQRRLARNVLRDVVGRYVGNDPDCLYALNEIQRVAALMRFELERGNVDEFAKLLDYHWSLSKRIDPSTTNTLIEQIFESVSEFICGRLVCGAGGGGFLQVILKKGVSKEDVQKRLKLTFQDNPAGVWDCEILS